MPHGENKYQEHQATDVHLLPVKEDDGSCGIHAAESCCWQAARMVFAGRRDPHNRVYVHEKVGSQGCAVSSGGSHIFSSARTDEASGSGAGIDSGFEFGSEVESDSDWESGSGQGSGSIQSVRRFTENDWLPVEAAKYLPSAVFRRKPWSLS